MKSFGIWPLILGLITVAVVAIFFNAAGGDPVAASSSKATSPHSEVKTRTQELAPASVMVPHVGSQAESNGQTERNESIPVATTPEQIYAVIEDAATSYSAEDLPKIKPYLTHPDPEIRKAARQGVVTLGDAAGGPLLREAAMFATSAEEATALREAADYVELPSGSLLNARTPKNK